MKKLLFLSGLFLLLFGMSSFAQTEISDWYDLNNVRNNLDGNYVLVNDLDENTAGYAVHGGPAANGGDGWEPIGTVTYQFTGSFDGNQYTISGLVIDRDDTEYIGLFGFVGVGGEVKNVGLEDVDVTGFRTTGGLVGQNEGTVSESYSTGSVTGLSHRTGGLVGRNIAGATITKSYATGNVTGRDRTGGLVGDNYGAISNSYVTSSVSGGRWEIGGLVGWNRPGASITNSYSTGSVTQDTPGTIGGLAGWNEATISNSFWDTQTSGQMSSYGGAGKTTAEMKDITTFSNAGWDIILIDDHDGTDSHIWLIDDGDDYPQLIFSESEYTASAVPLTNYAIYFGILLMSTFVVLRFKRVI